MKLVDEVVPPAELVETGEGLIMGGGKATKPWDQKGWKPPGGPVFSPAGFQLWPAANALYRKETYDNYPARALSCSPCSRACSCRWTRR